MKSSLGGVDQETHVQGFPGVAALSALRAWYAGMSATEAVAHYLSGTGEAGRSSRTVLADVRRQLSARARQCRRDDLARLLMRPASERQRHARAVMAVIDELRFLQPPHPQVSDPLERWLPERITRPMQAHGLRTLADLTVRVPRRRRWWATVPGLGAVGARQVEAFFSAHPALTEAARALVPIGMQHDVVPWERLYVPQDLNGSLGAFRAPRETCILSAANDYEAVQAWLSLHESAATQRCYRKEAERLILWAIVERRKALSSLTTEDAVAYRAFLRQPAPRTRWVGPAVSRSSPEWRPFAGALSARSIAYALSVAGALFRWLIQQRYVLANPFAGIKVRGASKSEALALTRVFGEGEWAIIQAVAEGLEWVHGWEAPAAHRLRFVLDFAYATGMRIGELVEAKLGQLEADLHGDHWLRLVGKGGKAGKVALPPLARSALNRYLMQRQLPTTPSRWNPKAPLIGSLDLDSGLGITATRLWSVVRRFFLLVATVMDKERPVLAEKLRRASPHWMRHTCATWLMEAGVDMWDAAAFTGMTVKVLEDHYAHHRPDYQSAARGAFGRGKR